MINLSLLLLLLLGCFQPVFSIIQIDNDTLSDFDLAQRITSNNKSTGLQEFTPIIDTIVQSDVKYYSFDVNTTSGLGEFYELLVFITGNICTQPAGIPENDTSLAVYYSFNSSMFEDNEYGQMSLFSDGYMQALADLPIGQVQTTEGYQPPTVLYIAVRAPENTNSSASWTYQIGVSQNDLVFQWDDREWVKVLDTDDTSAIVVTGNLSISEQYRRDKTMPYSLYVYSYGMKDYFTGLNNSWCAIRNGPALIGPDSIATSFTNSLDGTRQQFVVTGLNASTRYIGYVVAGSIGATTGGVVFHPFTFETMENDACQLIYGLEFCTQVAYSVPRPQGDPSVNITKQLYDNYTENLYTNFSKALQQIPCDAKPDSVFSNMKTCNDCANAYKDWLCAVMIPRCSTKNITGYQLREPNDGRNAFINDVVVPNKTYFEVLPCVNTCYAIVRDCPSDFGFLCPTKLPMSYFWDVDTGEGNEQWPSCNYVGKVVAIQSSRAFKLVLNYGVLLVLLLGSYSVI
ncbi:uncharacterized protein SPAPADRAFT_137955 [Spathaspora passalidarum NRRL Y-27907]|uniref:Stretch-activated cation channel Mid1 n=1 Tax=Spathaspora passalidarum (strain NRRL Y-27907 / 11-Y1) TaxID=619300 RepID=G3APL5_SPAPN|nr:uncharacterized protein SPAPADRAFT_137955 [Spathaspora passalidarum NRRL Y-27907]EGW32186.1 hypothetical protein SPAPADRAFT_137955 [Spathaspora passalidarum NRRL Y-27907]